MNSISTTFLAVGCVITALLICLIVFKILQIDNKEKDDVVVQEIEKFLNKFENEDELLFYNTSFKNRRLNNNLIILAIIIKGTNIFLVTDIVSAKRSEQIIFTGNAPYLIKGKHIKDVDNINYSWYEEIKKNLELELNNKYRIEVVCPILDNSLKIINNENKSVCYLSDIKEYLDTKSNHLKISATEKEKITKKIMNVNLSWIQ
ncbi:MAG: hypothetical protein HRT98_02940 [Mycoplasmatales bacterium]|nr:hypothetical protein [Mycoplasmatales bacterium]